LKEANDKFAGGVDLLHPGHVACPGCGAAVAMKFALQAMGPKTAVVIPACCWGVIAGPYPQSSLRVPILQTAFATAGAAASGLRAAMDITGDSESAVMAWAGDGGTFDIGLQSLSGAVERNEDIIYVCYDNEAYMNTGVQRSSSTPYGTHTTTTPEDGWKRSRKKNIMEIMAAHRIPYAASASIAFPDDMRQKFDKARRLKGGSRFLHVFATCPTGWGIPSELSIKIARLAVQCNIFPLYEVENGVRYTLNYQGDARVDAYLGLQGRFRYLSEKDIRYIQRMVDEDWDLLMRKM
jgi:pyruvate ferredoxin oxidoreductase beta subunit/2-oxoisovalerate ferredoxin oxidoreductase beta subunit